MIVPMEKVLVGCRAVDREIVLEAIRTSACVHLRPVETTPYHPPAELARRIENLEAAIHLAGSVPEPSKETAPTPESIERSAHRLVENAKRQEDIRARTDLLKKQLVAQRYFGSVAAADRDELLQHGVSISLHLVPRKASNKIGDPAIRILSGDANRGPRLVALLSDDDRILLPDDAVSLPFPDQSTDVLHGELTALETEYATLRTEQKEGAALLFQMQRQKTDLVDLANWHRAMEGATHAGALFVVQGWIPTSRKDQLNDALGLCHADTATTFFAPGPDDTPPTFWDPPRAARPTRGLFHILGTMPGYEESDVSTAFLVALPIFCAMLIADGGYGLLILLGAIFGYRIASDRAGKELATLLIVIGAVATIWGICISSFFGVGGAALLAQPGILGSLGEVLGKLRLIGGDLAGDEAVQLLMKVSFLLGAIHMATARLWRGVRLLPGQEAIAQFGWAVFIFGILLLTNALVLDAPVHSAMVPLLAIGGVLVILFTRPDKNFLKRIGLGLGGFPLSAIGTLSDTISYIRLMAVGLASTILAATFNTLAAEVAREGTWVAGALVLVLGHGLNIGLAIVALFAHGVRLNMLEFSNHLGMTWSGSAYAPFASLKTRKEEE